MTSWNTPRQGDEEGGIKEGSFHGLREGGERTVMKAGRRAARRWTAVHPASRRAASGAPSRCRTAGATHVP